QLRIPQHLLRAYRAAAPLPLRSAADLSNAVIVDGGCEGLRPPLLSGGGDRRRIPAAGAPRQLPGAGDDHAVPLPLLPFMAVGVVLRRLDRGGGAAAALATG